MKINADFDERVVVHGARLDWIASPMAGVDRRPLDRVGDEVARATSIVRYAPGSRFSRHVHTGGEEFIVLDGVFQDEHGDFPPGSYIRNPPESSHTPRSDDGCTIFVKLWQFDPDDRAHVRLRIDRMAGVPLADGVSKTPLYQDAGEEVSIFELAPGARLSFDGKNGIEVLVLSGEVLADDERLVELSWLRSPLGEPVSLVGGARDARIWVKSGHLNRVDQEVERVVAV